MNTLTTEQKIKLFKEVKSYFDDADNYLSTFFINISDDYQTITELNPKKNINEFREYLVVNEIAGYFDEFVEKIARKIFGKKDFEVDEDTFDLYYYELLMEMDADWISTLDYECCKHSNFCEKYIKHLQSN